MSVPSSTSKVQYLLSSSTQTLTVPFYFLENSHLKVIKIVGAVQTVLVLGTDYTVTGAGVEAGGAIILTGTATAAGNTVTIKRSIPITQLVDYVYNDRFPAETHERALDKLTMICQFLQEQAERSLRFEDGEVLDGTLTLEARKGKSPQFNSATGELELVESVDNLTNTAVVQAQAAASASQASANTAAALANDAESSAIRAEDAAESLGSIERATLPLGRLRGKIAGVTAGEVASILFWGDSIVLSLIPPGVLYQLYAQYGFRGLWLQLADSQSEVNGIGMNGATTVQNEFAVSLNGNVGRLTAANQNMSFSAPDGGAVLGAVDRRTNRATVVYATKPGGGTFKLQYCRGNASQFEGTVWVDVAGATAISTNAAVGVASFVVNYPTLDLNRVRALWVSGQVDIVGAEIENTTVGGLVLGFANRGGIAMSSVTAAMSNATLTALLNIIAPDLIYSTWKDESTPTTITPVLQAMQAKWDACYLTQWLFVAPYPDSVVATEAQVRALADAYIAHARAGGHAFWDPTIEVKDYATAVALGVMGDATHFNVKGQTLCGNKLWQATGLLPAASEARTGAALRLQSVSAESLFFGANSVADAVLSMKQTARMRSPYLRFPPLLEASVRNYSFGSALGTTAFTVLIDWRIESGAGIHYPFMFRNNQFGGGWGNNDMTLQIANGDIKVLSYNGSAQLSDFLFVGAAADFWALSGKMVSIALRRNSAPAPGEHAMTLFLNGKKYYAYRNSGSGAQTDAVSGQVFALGSTNGAVSVGGGPTCNLLGGALYTRALTDAEVLGWSLSGQVPDDPRYHFPCDDASGVVTRGFNNLGAIKAGFVVNPVAWHNVRYADARFRGHGQLVNGVLTVNDPAIQADDLVIITRRTAGLSTAIGLLECSSITPGSSFQIVSRRTTNVIETNDSSSVSFVVLPTL
jgi:hypothetical protein